METIGPGWSSLIEPADGPLAHAGWRALAAAVDCARLGDGDGEGRCRERALELWAEAEQAGEPIVAQGLPAAQLVLAEVLRRIGRFEEARGRCHRGLSGRPEEPFRSLLEFELELITAGDTAAHSVSEAVGKWG